MMGEEVFLETVSGNTGLNTITWLLKNNEQASVANGLYIYTVQVSDGNNTTFKTGKVMVLH